MPDPFIGQIMPVGFNYAPDGYAKCDGSQLSISQNQALFSVLGTTYGGDGRTTFALPDLRGRHSLHQGQGPGLNNYPIGSKGGAEEVTLSTNEMPAHTHTVHCNTDPGNATNPSNAYPASETVTNQDIYSDTANANMNANMNADAGGSKSHQNLSPYLTINYIIALTGVYPAH